MNNLPSIFISYNSGSEFDETFAIRLHTIGAVHGFTVYLPDRYNNPNVISLGTQERINVCDYYILFSTGILTQVALQEIQYAFNRFKDKSRIIVIYDAAVGQNMQGTDSCTQLFFDRNKENPESFIGRVMQQVQNHHNTTQQKKKEEALAGLILAGIGLLLLGTTVAKK